MTFYCITTSTNYNRSIILKPELDIQINLNVNLLYAVIDIVLCNIVLCVYAFVCCVYAVALVTTASARTMASTRAIPCKYAAASTRATAYT